VALDDKCSRGSRIVFQDDKDEDRRAPALETSTHGGATGGAGHGNDPTGECFQSLLPAPMFMWVSLPLRARRGRC
jgi:hypothetical protein